ncbi:MAG: hypothetical protein ACNA77_03525 [Opitutales bacterium]
MPTAKISTTKHLWATAGLLTFSLSLPLSAYQQGSLFLFDLRQEAGEEGVAGRKVIASSIFKIEAEKAKSEIAEGKPQITSEFESGLKRILSGETSVPTTSGLDILKLENETISGESSFGESSPPPSGFFFTY